MRRASATLPPHYRRQAQFGARRRMELGAGGVRRPRVAPSSSFARSSCIWRRLPDTVSWIASRHGRASRAPDPALVARAEGQRVRVASEVVDGTHDVLVVGGGCAGMRAAIAASDAGPTSQSSPSSIPSVATPARPRVGSMRRWATPAKTARKPTPSTPSGAPTAWATRTPSSSSRRGARRHLPARALGLLLHA